MQTRRAAGGLSESRGHRCFCSCLLIAFKALRPGCVGRRAQAGETDAGDLFLPPLKLRGLASFGKDQSFLLVMTACGPDVQALMGGHGCFQLSISPNGFGRIFKIIKIKQVTGFGGGRMSGCPGHVPFGLVSGPDAVWQSGVALS